MITTNIQSAILSLTNNDVVGIPTETVYGLVANAYNEEAIKKIFKLKNRPFYNPLIVHLKSINELTTVAQNIPKIAYTLAEAFWPGPLTLLLEKKSNIPNIVTAGKKTVAVRVPNHPLTLELLAKLPFPLVAPSANPFTSISPTNAQHVFNYFGNNIDVILDGGECKRGIESIIIGFDNEIPTIYRLGSITLEAIEKISGKIAVNSTNNIAPVAPGMLSKHYAPKTKTILVENAAEYVKNCDSKKIGLLVFNQSVINKKIYHQELLSKSGNMDEAAKNLYAALHRLDNLNLDLIITQKLPDFGIGKTINDKLKRASK